jgi:hypothetical protein
VTSWKRDAGMLGFLRSGLNLCRTTWVWKWAEEGLGGKKERLEGDKSPIAGWPHHASATGLIVVQP